MLTTHHANTTSAEGDSTPVVLLTPQHVYVRVYGRAMPQVPNEVKGLFGQAT